MDLDYVSHCLVLLKHEENYLKKARHTAIDIFVTDRVKASPPTVDLVVGASLLTSNRSDLTTRETTRAHSAMQLRVDPALRMLAS